MTLRSTTCRALLAGAVAIAVATLATPTGQAAAAEDELDAVHFAGGVAGGYLGRGRCEAFPDAEFRVLFTIAASGAVVWEGDAGFPRPASDARGTWRRSAPRQLVFTTVQMRAVGDVAPTHFSRLTAVASFNPHLGGFNFAGRMAAYGPAQNPLDPDAVPHATTTCHGAAKRIPAIM